MPTIGRLSITIAGEPLRAESAVLHVEGRPDQRYERDVVTDEWWRIAGLADEVNAIVRRVMGNGEV